MRRKPGSSQTFRRWLGGTRKVAMPELGAREISVLEALWRQGAASAQEIREHLQEGVSLSTVQSTLERLCRKGLVRRRRTGRAYWHEPALSRSQLIGRILQNMADELAGGKVGPMVSGFAEYLSDEAPEWRSELADLMKRDDGSGE